MIYALRGAFEYDSEAVVDEHEAGDIIPRIASV